MDQRPVWQDFAPVGLKIYLPLRLGLSAFVAIIIGLLPGLALPLSADEQSIIKNDLTGRGAGEVAFKVDPRILGGLVVRVGDRVVDASVSGQLESLKQSLG